ncbi:hypothetical protein GGX14DRAFT_562863 [Mycena pura]|uniref:Uncharacterized protein n=1 Tax=Mycena pura TaxID=153505 RepID=A0AAD6VKG4_9AGAR|nr:hypothetical protein GGX14DRAFT_562863 [Mycena pura]
MARARSRAVHSSLRAPMVRVVQAGCGGGRRRACACTARAIVERAAMAHGACGARRGGGRRVQRGPSGRRREITRERRTLKSSRALRARNSRARSDGARGARGGGGRRVRSEQAAQGDYARAPRARKCAAMAHAVHAAAAEDAGRARCTRAGGGSRVVCATRSKDQCYKRHVLAHDLPAPPARVRRVLNDDTFERAGDAECARHPSLRTFGRRARSAVRVLQAPRARA